MSEDFYFATVKQFEGRDLGASDWMVVERTRIDAFAECTDDVQWIHPDRERRRRESPAGAPVAHSFLLLSLLATLLMEVGVVPLDARRVMNRGVKEARFKTPVRAGNRVRARVKLSKVEEEGGRLRLIVATTLEVEKEKAPALIADLVLILIP